MRKPDCPAATSGRFRMMGAFLVVRMRSRRVTQETVQPNLKFTPSRVQRSFGPAPRKQSRSDDVAGAWLGVADSGDGGKGATAAADPPPAGSN